MRKFMLFAATVLLISGLGAVAAAQQPKPADQSSSQDQAVPAGVIGARIGSSAPRPNDQALPADAPARNEVLTLLDLMQARKSFDAAMSTMKQIMRQSAEEGFRERVPNPTPKQLAALGAMVDGALDSFSQDEMINVVIPIYQRHLTKTDIEEMIRFYSSPVGQKLLHEQPQIMQESMQAGAELGRSRMNEIMAKFKERETELMDSEGNDPPKKP